MIFKKRERKHIQEMCTLAFSPIDKCLERTKFTDKFVILGQLLRQWNRVVRTSTLHFLGLEGKNLRRQRQWAVGLPDE